MRMSENPIRPEIRLATLGILQAIEGGKLHNYEIIKEYVESEEMTQTELLDRLIQASQVFLDITKQYWLIDSNQKYERNYKEN